MEYTTILPLISILTALCLRHMLCDSFKSMLESIKEKLAVKMCLVTPANSCSALITVDINNEKINPQNSGLDLVKLYTPIDCSNAIIVTQF